MFAIYDVQGRRFRNTLEHLQKVGATQASQRASLPSDGGEQAPQNLAEQTGDRTADHHPLSYDARQAYLDILHIKEREAVVHAYQLMSHPVVTVPLAVEFSSHFPQPDASDSELKVSVYMSGYARNLIADLGPLRAVLLLLGLLSAAFTPLAGDGIDYEGWGLLKTVFGPVFAPMIFMVLIMDSVITRATSAEASDERRRAGRIVRINLLVMAIIAVSWVPFILAIRN